ncbi:D-alanyl-D-alanine carboxypeptidase [Seinonella peptonophila]|uniref:D-alanyl-D-alanine carboxypeptidase n=1 Tax=Seinonella peptonophila TaxID=112248 RepID=A0A1M4WDG2_9BACL|nr:D-alanyl-D-alanine carboxypeptidase family protein [Seinonella peptonophila]SHE79321.1 D-alanyl-D-alanine carboxypeptidase [Seinonella peptonophila]
MNKYISSLIILLFIQLLFSPVAIKAEPNPNLTPSLSDEERKQLHQPRIYEDSNENEPVQSLKKSDSSKDSSGPQIEAASYVLINDQTGKVMAQKDQNEPRPPASMTKMMTAYLVLDQIQQKRIHWDDEVVVSKRAAAIDEAQIFLVENERITVKELMKGVMVQSGNDAAVALAEYAGGTEEKFVEMMNHKAKQLGLRHTHFNNASGLDHKDYPDPPKSPGNHVMSAADTVQLGRSLVKVHPGIFKFSTIAHYTFHPGTDREQKVTNWNRMLPGLEYEYQGVDGIKTGSTSAAGYCFTGTVERDHQRLFSVVMGAPTVAKRFTETKKLYDYGFQQLAKTKRKHIEKRKAS